ncbi:B12-binding domain-containing radical SAM protein [bacterium]|nr:B12-binding domain-containing radical SAM protein [bacterium]
MNNDFQKKNRKQVLLVYPEIPPTYWSFKYALSFIRKKVSLPPLGLLTIAAMLPDNYEPELIDMNFMPLTDEMISQADLVFASAMIVQKDSLACLAKRCKSAGVPIVAGGPYPTSFYDRIEDVDYFVLNEAELTLHRFLNDYEKGHARHIYMDKGKPDITKSPAPRFDLVKMRHYGSMALQYSRGCPFNCEFCDIIEMFGHKPRTKTNQQIINELDMLYNNEWRGSVFIVDDNFIGNKHKVKQLLPEIANWQRQRNYPFDLFTEASINLAADVELLDLMSEAGFNMVFIGIETPVEDTLLKAGKKQNIKHDMLDSIIKIQNKGIEVTGGFIVGFDTDPPDIFDRQIKFIQESGIGLAMVGLLTALPNTQLYRRLEKEGRLLQDSSGNNTHDLQVNFRPNMDLNTLINGYKFIIKSIYDPKTYFDRCLVFLRNIKPHQNSSRKVRAEELSILFRSLFKQSFTAYGHHYLSFLFKALIIQPRMFPEAVRQAILGHHFFKITHEILAVDDFKSYAKSITRIYVEKIREAYAPFNIENAIIELKIAKDKFIKELQSEYHKIDEDFRHLVEDSLESVESSLNLYYSQWLEALANA